jgi:hypothetical protein
MSKAQKLKINLPSQFELGMENVATLPSDIKNNTVAKKQNISTTPPSEALDIARLLARIAVENYFSEAKPNQLG